MLVNIFILVQMLLICILLIFAANLFAPTTSPLAKNPRNLTHFNLEIGWPLINKCLALFRLLEQMHLLFRADCFYQ